MKATVASASAAGVKRWNVWEIPERVMSFTRLHLTPRKTILITKTDERRLRALARRHERYGVVAALEAELTRATIVAPESVPPDVVTMNSRVVYSDSNGISFEVKLVYPTEASSVGDTSVLTGLGTALLGVRTGEETSVIGEGPVRVSRVLYQPERAGDFHL
jgi:regulator of nucleoside diphosphate kinase